MATSGVLVVGSWFRVSGKRMWWNEEVVWCTGVIWPYLEEDRGVPPGIDPFKFFDYTNKDVNADLDMAEKEK